MKKLIPFLIPLMTWGQCDMEIIGFDLTSTDITICVNGGACGSDADSIGEFILSINFNPPLLNNPFPCFPSSDYTLLLYPLDFPGFDIGQGPDDILQTGDTITFNIIDDTALAGSGTLECWRQLFADAVYLEECLVLSVYQINDSDTVAGGSGLGGFPYPDEDISNSSIEFSLNGSCDPPPPPIVLGCTDPTAYNYWARATYDDGSCVYQGCLDPEALNYCEYCEIDGDCVYNPIVDECEDPCIKVPNTFTPNGDNINEYWQVITIDNCWMDWECRIFNRWGQSIWWSVDPGDTWDGTYKGEPVSDGVYVWTIRGTSFRSTKVVNMNGYVTVFR